MEIGHTDDTSITDGYGFICFANLDSLTLLPLHQPAIETENGKAEAAEKKTANEFLVFGAIA